MNSNTPDGWSRAENLGIDEEFLRIQLLHNATHEYFEAKRLNALHGGYLGESVIETPVPTVFYRMDSKTEYLDEHRALRRHQLYVYVPKDADPEQFLERIWVKHIQPNGVQAMFEISEYEAKTYMRPHEVEADLDAMYREAEEELMPEAEELALAGLLEAAQTNRTARGLSRLTQALRDDFTHVSIKG